MREKLERQFELYRQARVALMNRVNVEKSTYGLEEWTRLLSPEPNCRLSNEELAELKAQQNAEAARARATSQSRIDLDSIRAQPEKVKALCAALPKGGILHEHEAGTMNRETARNLLTLADPKIDPKYWSEKSRDPNIELYAHEYEWIETHSSETKYSLLSPEDQARVVDFFFLPKDSLTHSFKRFSFPFLVFPILRNKEINSDYLQLEVFLKRARSMGIRYVEFTKGLRLAPGFTEPLRKMAADLKASTGVVVRWNHAFFRNADPAKNGKQSQTLLELLKAEASKEIVGIDIVANEETAPALEAGQQSYAPVLSSGTKLHRTFHAGELGRIENVRDAMIMGAERVGHGVLLEQDPVTLEYARREKLGVEVSPTSNLRLKVVKSLKDHPFLKFLRLGLKVSLATDDEGVLETDINTECEKVIAETDVTYSEMKEMAFNSIETSFADAAGKRELLEWLQSAFDDFEKSY